MKNTIIKVANESESQRVQQKLFELGIFWMTGVKTIQLLDRNFLIIDTENSFGMAITCRKKMPEDIRFSCYCKYGQIDAYDFLKI
jgi:hypothetical protein